MDIFTNTPPDAASDALLAAMQAHHDNDLQVIRSQGRIPDWEGEPRPLNKSLARVLNYTYENGPFAWTASASANNRKMTAALGFHSPVNAHEAVMQCYEAGLLNYDAGSYHMSQPGEYALEEWLLEAEVSNMDVCKALAAVDAHDWDVDDEFANMWGIR